MSLDFRLLHAFASLGDVGFWRDWDSKKPLFFRTWEEGC